MKRWTTTIASLALASTPTFAQEALNTRQLEALSPKAANHQAQQDLLSILTPTGQYHRGRSRSIHSIEFFTKPHATSYEGLCSLDIVALQYRAAEPEALTRETALRPYSVTASPVYHFLKTPKTVPKYQELPDNAWEDDCEAVRDHHAHWFWADSPAIAARGVLMLDAALNAIETGAVTPVCVGEKPDRQACVAWIKDNFNLEKLLNAEPCPGSPAVECFVLNRLGAELTVKAQFNGFDQMPGKILSVEGKPLIVVD